MNSAHPEIIDPLVKVKACSIIRMQRLHRRYVLIYRRPQTILLLAIESTASVSPNNGARAFCSHLIISIQQTHFERWIDHFEEGPCSHLAEHTSCWACLASWSCYRNILFGVVCGKSYILENGIHDWACSYFIFWGRSFLLSWIKLS